MEQPNMDYLNKLSGNDETIKLKLTNILKKELPLEIAAYYGSILLKKRKLAAECVHKLKHKIALLGLEESYYMAEEYENQLVKNEIELQTEFENCLKVMQHFVNSL